MKFTILKVTEKSLPEGMKEKKYTGESGSSCNGAIGMRQMLGGDKSSKDF